jgi:hypothetical protein
VVIPQRLLGHAAIGQGVVRIRKVRKFESHGSFPLRIERFLILWGRGPSLRNIR